MPTPRDCDLFRLTQRQRLVSGQERSLQERSLGHSRIATHTLGPGTGGLSRPAPSSAHGHYVGTRSGLARRVRRGLRPCRASPSPVPSVWPCMVTVAPRAVSTSWSGAPTARPRGGRWNRSAAPAHSRPMRLPTSNACPFLNSPASLTGPAPLFSAYAPGQRPIDVAMGQPVSWSRGLLPVVPLDALLLMELMALRAAPSRPNDRAELLQSWRQHGAAVDLGRLACRCGGDRRRRAGSSGCAAHRTRSARAHRRRAKLASRPLACISRPQRLAGIARRLDACIELSTLCMGLALASGQ